MPKRVGADPTTNMVKNLAKAVELDTSLVDSQLNVDPELNETQRMSDEILKADAGNTLLSPEDYQGFSPDIQVGGRSTEGLSSEAIASIKTLDTTNDGQKGARAATKIDLSKLDESMIMSMPFIKPSDNAIPAILFLKPKDASIRFHWVNFKNWEGGNYAKYKAYGFENATLEDIDTEATPVGPDCIDGTSVKWYDVILMKINVFKLMSLYKRNIMSSLKMVGRFKESARSMAQKQFDHDIHNGLTQSGRPLAGVLAQMKQAGYNVDFYVPGLEEVTAQDKNFLHDDV